MTTRINKRYQLKHAVSADASRYVIQNIHVDNGSAIATNGLILAVVPTEPESVDGDYCAKTLAAKAKVYKSLDHVEPDPVEHADGNTYSYPNYKAVIPNFEKKQTIKMGLDVELLLKLAKALGVGNNKKCVVHLEFVPEDGQVLGAMRVVDGLDNTNKAFGVIMPCRIK